MCRHADTDRMRRRVRRLHIFDQRILLHTGLFALVLLSSCSNNKVNVAFLQVKSPPTGEKNMTLRSSYMFGKTLMLHPGTLGVYDVFIANYDLETQSLPREVNKPTKDGEILVTFHLVANQGSTATSPTPGTYSLTREYGPMGIEPVSVTMVSRQNGVNHTSFNKPGKVGSVEIKSISDGMIIGEINLTAGDTSVKGVFNSWIVVAKG
jgi:hypothetical protein